MDQISIVEKENVLKQARRTYEESERSLKSICNSVEQENNELEEEFKSEPARLADRQLVIDQQTKQIHLRYEQAKKALKKIVSVATLTNDDFSDETFSMFGF
ncbi:unnamed protein product [Rotaria magnacalcarata]|uniref:Uncharacterized protein n=1 Tax=Rotaria magnacalcarata TaxID=392030 RepID=A0A816N1K7_9BILA|nr:unnamed protein product [Rotaria magnacalcarata]